MNRSTIKGYAQALAVLSLLFMVGSAAGVMIHPDFRLLDADGRSVLESGAPLSTMKTCGACHDTEYIDEHNSHAHLAIKVCDPVLYRAGAPREMEGPTAEEWIIQNGRRCVGGGSLREILELDCFLCHIPEPDNAARNLARENGELNWMSTATLSTTGLIEHDGEAWTWNHSLFNEKGEAKSGLLDIIDPGNRNCGYCHGYVHMDNDSPVRLEGESLEIPESVRRGQILSPQRIALSAMNIEDKAELSRPWDAHLARVVDCVDCHYSTNNPTYFERSAKGSLKHLHFDARRIDISEFLYRPNHILAAGQTMRSHFKSSEDVSDCENCHDPSPVHTWLPYWQRHLQVVRCETCHIPKVYAPALQQVDWTVLDESGQPLRIWRGWDGDPTDPEVIGQGFTPLLVPCAKGGGGDRIAPFNLVSSWYWTHGDSALAVPATILEDLLFDEGEPGRFRSALVDLFDDDGDGELSEIELRLVDPMKTEYLRRGIESRGFDNVKIKSLITPYGLHHNIVGGEWATKECEDCHSNASRIGQPFPLSSYLPGGVELVPSLDCVLQGKGLLDVDESGAIRFQPSKTAEGVYILGLTSVPWVDGLGIVLMLGTLLGILVHSLLRFRASRKLSGHVPKTERVYMYSLYERLWHWLQAMAIIGLVLTGLVVHKTEIFTVMNFKTAVLVHNVLGFAMLGNAMLALFYHIASGQIRQYLPEPRGVFSHMIQQGRYYAYGIFHGEPHPFQKHPERRLNPLQQVTYFGILNILLPLQVFSGLLIWGTQRWPDLTFGFGGLPFLAPAHSLLAWVFSSFIVMHVYLTTTGHRPMAAIQSMVDGWDEVEIHDSNKEGK
jgi:thiosulfate reductase cytochrome b subunit